MNSVYKLQNQQINDTIFFNLLYEIAEIRVEGHFWLNELAISMQVSCLSHDGYFRRIPLISISC